MSIMAPFVDGKLQTSTTSSDSLSSDSNKNAVTSDTFLTLLVAEMQNQDPLEPTSNTEWVSQYATFTQVQQMSEMGNSMDLLRANSLIGKEVMMKVTSQSTGETSYMRGVVDYVVVEDGEPLLVIGENKYSISDLDTVASDEYFTAYDMYSEFCSKIDALPALSLIDASYENTIGELYEMYNSMTDYQKDYVDTYGAGYVESYKAYLAKLEQFGVTFEEDTSTEEATSLDDILDSFDKRMEQLMAQLSSLQDKISSTSTTTDNSQSSGTTTDTSATDASTTDTTDTDTTVTDTTQTEDSQKDETNTEAEENTTGTVTDSQTETTEETVQTETVTENTATETVQESTQENDEVSAQMLDQLTTDL